MEEVFGDGAVESRVGRDQRRKWSPEVAMRSVRFFDEGGSQSTLVMG